MSKSNLRIYLPLLLPGLLVALAVVCFASRKDAIEYPDYTRLEYAKPLPPPDQQVEAPGPGSIHMVVGDRKRVVEGASLESLPVALLHPDVPADESEPSMADVLELSTQPVSAVPSPSTLQ
jgi:hypothetical protein